MKKNIVIILVVIAVVSIVIFGLVFRYKVSRPKGLIAFVIDDWGYNTKNVDLLFEMKRPITISILPNLLYSNEIGEVVRKKGKVYDIILHLPLESKSNRTPESDTIRCNMEKQKILSILERDIKGLPGAIGVSNHQGSKATEDRRTMRIVLSELKKRKLFFLDSLTTPNTVCPEVSREVGLKCTQRDVFLDLTEEKDPKQLESYIRKQIRELASIAIDKGSAIGVGHAKAITLKVIKDSLPELERQRIRIAPLKRLVK